MCATSPVTLEWESLGAPYGAWLSWIAEGGTAEFCQSARWPDGQEENCALPVSHRIIVYLFLWSREAHEDLAGTTRRPTPMARLFSLQADFAAQLAANQDTNTVNIRIE